MDSQTPSTPAPLPRLYEAARKNLTPLLVINCIGMGLAGGALLLAGQAGAVWIFAVAFFVAPPFLFPFLMLPAGFFSGAMILAQRGGRAWPARLFSVCAVGWLVAMLALWAALVFDHARGVSAPGNEGVLRAAALAWCVSAAGAPWADFARRDTGNIFFTGLVFMQQAGCLALAAAELSAPQDLMTRFLVVAGVMAALAAVQAVYESVFMKK